MTSELVGPKIVVIGAGIGGVSFAIGLKRRFGYENYTIYEKASDVGGTWRDNMYPGCSSDISINFYSLSTDPYHGWNNSHPFQPEIQSYWRKLATKYDVYSHLVFNTVVLSIEWNDSEQQYHIVTQDAKTGVTTHSTAQIVISALGILEVNKFPNIEGIETFKGTKFHSGAWRADVDLKGKRVGVIGNGASSTQFVPIISQDPDVQILQFCRTPNWFLPPIRTPYSSFRKWLCKYVPLYMRSARLYGYLTGEGLYFSVFGTRFLHPFMTKLAKNYILTTSPEKYHDALIPNFPLGCKRIIFDSGFLEALHRPNLKLIWDGIDKITEDGVVTKTGEEFPLDILICATGYIADDFPLHVRGRTQTVREYNSEKGGPQAYLGTTVPGFPNLFMIGGPNTTTGHTSVLYTEEVQIQYTLDLLAPILSGAITSVEVTHAATDAYNEKIHAKLRRSVFTSCLSWYRRGRDGKIVGIFPGAATLFTFWLRKVNWGSYVVREEKGKEGTWERARRRRRNFGLLGRLVVTVAVIALVGGFYSGRLALFDLLRDQTARGVDWYGRMISRLVKY